MTKAGDKILAGAKAALAHARGDNHGEDYLQRNIEMETMPSDAILKSLTPEDQEYVKAESKTQIAEYKTLKEKRKGQHCAALNI